MPRYMVTRRWLVEADDPAAAAKAARAGQHVDQVVIPVPGAVTEDDVARLDRDGITPWWVIRGTREARKDRE